jgi:hypothetical protein
MSHCTTALARSFTGNSHHVSHDGCSGYARKVGNCSSDSSGRARCYSSQTSVSTGQQGHLRTTASTQKARHLPPTPLQTCTQVSSTSFHQGLPLLLLLTSPTRSSSAVRCMMRVKALMLLPPGICWISFMLAYLPAAAAARRQWCESCQAAGGHLKENCSKVPKDCRRRLAAKNSACGCCILKTPQHCCPAHRLEGPQSCNHATTAAAAYAPLHTTSHTAAYMMRPCMF